MRLKEPGIKPRFKRPSKPLLFAVDLIGARWASVRCAIINIPELILLHIPESIDYAVHFTEDFIVHAFHSLYNLFNLISILLMPLTCGMRGLFKEPYSEKNITKLG